MSTDGWSAATHMLATHLLSTAAVVVASQRSLTSYLAVSALPQPILPQSEPPASIDLQGIKAFFGKPWVRKAGAISAGIIMVLAVYAVVIGAFAAAFRFASQAVLDTLLATMFGGFFTFSFYGSLEILLSLPTTVAFMPQAKEKAKQWRLARFREPTDGLPWYLQRRTIWGVSAGLAALELTTVALGYRWALVVIPATWLIPVVSNFCAPRMSIRRVSQVILAYLAVLLLAAAIIFPIVAHFQKSEAAPDESDHKEEWTVPSRWLEEISHMFQFLYIIAAPGVLIAMSWRFDYVSQHTHQLGSTPSAERILVPHLCAIPSFAPRVSIYAIGALAVCVTGLTGTFVIDPRLGDALSSSGGLVVVVPVMLATTAFGAWRQGLLQDWWRYEETWVPSTDEELSLEHSPCSDLPLAEKGLTEA